MYLSFHLHSSSDVYRDHSHRVFFFVCFRFLSAMMHMLLTSIQTSLSSRCADLIDA